MQKIIRSAWRSFVCHLHRYLRFCGGMFIVLAWLALSIGQAQTTYYALGTPALLVGPGAGSNSIVLGVNPATAAWIATANTNWLHLDANNQSGTGSTNIIFSYDANPSATRSGTLTIGDQTLSVTQAASNCVEAGMITLMASETNLPTAMAVDGVGNVYFANLGVRARLKIDFHLEIKPIGEVGGVSWR